MTIIQTIEYDPFTLARVIVLCIGITGVIMSILSAILIETNKEQTALWKIGIMYICVIGFSITLLTGFMMAVLKSEYTETRYQILIDNNTTITEVQEKYEIIGQQGISYIVVEKENDLDK